MTYGRRIRSYPFGPSEALALDPTYAELRTEEPLSRVRLPYGEDSWLVTRYDDVRLLLSDPRFSRRRAIAGDPPRLRKDGASGTGLLGMDPPGHARTRKITAKVFTDRRAQVMRDTEQAVAALVDEVAEQSEGQRAFDLVDSLAFQIPAAVIGRLLGLPAEDHLRIRGWSQDLMSTAEDDEGRARRAYEALLAYVEELVAARRAHPAPDLVSLLTESWDEGTRCTDEELTTQVVGLITKGAETTASQIPNFVYALLTHPDQFDLLRREPGLVPRAVEELLRWIPFHTVSLFPRYATEDVRFRDVTVRAGEYVLPSLASANRDPEVFADPEHLDITRVHNPHVSFGHGVHHCLGSQLARTELQVTLMALVRRFPGLALAGDPADVPWRPGLVRSPRSLWVSW